MCFRCTYTPTPIFLLFFFKGGTLTFTYLQLMSSQENFNLKKIILIPGNTAKIKKALIAAVTLERTAHWIIPWQSSLAPAFSLTHFEDHKESIKYQRLQTATLKWYHVAHHTSRQLSQVFKRGKRKRLESSLSLFVKKGGYLPPFSPFAPHKSCPHVKL